MEEAPENGEESLHSSHADGMNELQIIVMADSNRQLWILKIQTTK
jgi:hypothetical protein